jgi:phosphatidylethanolamine/phosphatidyl-N-methylethanolamine N-methyltransferase
MTLFGSPDSIEREEFFGSDAATRALSVTEVETDFVHRVYQQIAKVYDFTFGPTLHAGRLQAIQRMRIDPGSDVLEVGVGTGINAALYPRHCNVTGIDLSARMLAKARVRLARKGVRNVRLIQMDATALTFADDTFDIVYAPYVISVVPDPVAVAREMHRVCKPGGRIVVLNHFRSRSKLGAFLETAIAPVTPYLGFKSDVDLPAFLAQADFDPISIEKVNVPPIWSLITCIKE